MSKTELRNLYIAKDDEHDRGITALQRRKEESCSVGVGRLATGMAVYFFSEHRDTRLPTDALIELANQNHDLEKLIVDPPIGFGVAADDDEYAFAARHIEDFFRNCAFTLKDIQEQPFTFPPGHPVSRTFYKQHPLASHRPEKRNYFIPSSMYDAVLFAEREAELIGILVDLGAIRIRICKSSANSSLTNVSMAGKVGVSAAEVAARFKAMSAAEQESFDNRELELDGCPWYQGETLDRSKYGWLHFEPEWEAIVKAREVGHCRTAEIELFKRTSFHSESEAAVKLRKHFAKVEASVAQTRSGTEVGHKLIQVEFGPALPPKRKGWLAKLTG